MPRIVREAEIDWEGTTARGSGVVRAASTGSFELSVDDRISDRGDRGEDQPRRAPRRSACNLFRHLSRKRAALALGNPPERMHVHCTITMDEVEGAGHRIVSSDIAARAVVPGADDATLAAAAEAADAGCPFSALIRASATVTVEAVLEGGDS